MFDDVQYKDFIKYRFSYDGETLVCKNIDTGRKLKNSMSSAGYKKFGIWKGVKGIDKKQYNANEHRIIMEIIGSKPDGKNFIDHIDRIKTNNSFVNLRWVDKSENAYNSDRCEYAKHYCWNKKMKMYQIGFNKTIFGNRKTLEEAIAFVKEMRILYYKK